MNTLTLAPVAGSLWAAYKPIVFKFQTDHVSPISYCDIYFNGIYYASISKTSADLNNVFTFDIETVVQEYLRTPSLSPIGGYVSILTAVTSCVCKFRSTTLDSQGFIIQNSTAPIQGTYNTLPISGTGLVADAIYVIGAASIDGIDTYKQGTWDNNVHPLTHRRKLSIGKTDNAYFPIINDSNKVLTCLKLNYRLKSTSAWNVADNCGEPGCNVDITNLISLWSIANNRFEATWSTAGTADHFDLEIVNDTATFIITGNSATYVFPNKAHTLRIRACCSADCLSAAGWIYYSYEPSNCTPITRTSYTSDGTSIQVYANFNLTETLAGTMPFMDNGSVVPSWLTRVLSGSTHRVDGIPSFSDVGSNPINLKALNGCGTINNTYPLAVTAPPDGTYYLLTGVYGGGYSTIDYLCRITFNFNRLARATEEATYRNKRVKATYQLNTNTGCMQTIDIIFEPTTSEVNQLVIFTCSVVPCNTATYNVLSVVVIP